MFLPATMYQHKGCCSWNTIHHSSAVCSNNAETSNAAVGTLCPLIMLCSFVFKDVRNCGMFSSIIPFQHCHAWISGNKPNLWLLPSKGLLQFGETTLLLWCIFGCIYCENVVFSNLHHLHPKPSSFPSLVDNNNIFITHSSRISPKNPSESLPLLVNPLFARKNSITPGFHSMRCDQKVHISARKTLNGRAFHL